MRFFGTTCAAAFAALCLCLSSSATPAQAATPDAPKGELTIFDASTPLDSIRLQGVEVTRVDDGALAIKNGTTDRWPGIHFEDNWNLADYGALILDVRSTSDEEITLYCRMDSAKSDLQTMDGVVTREMKLKPGESKRWRIEFESLLNPEVREKLFAMRGKPGGIKTDSYSVDKGAAFDRSELIAIRPFENQNGRGDSWVLEKIVAEPVDPAKLATEEYLQWPPEKFFPMIDEFGQFKHKDWPGKTHSVEELRAQIEEEDADLAANQPAEFNQYGGWANGPQLEATGAFRVEKVNGFWYFVDPEGKLFWSHGVDCVGYDSATTPLTDREFYFDPAIPTSRDSDSEYAQFLSVSSHSVNNYYVGRGEYLNYNFSASNLYKKYGPEWREAHRALVPRRLRSWGLNTIANWSNPSVYLGAKTPYTATTSTGGPSIAGSSGYWGKFVDPFSEEFARRTRDNIAWIAERTADDPWCIGYFVDNEISWGEKGSLAVAALASPEGQPVKNAYVDWLREKYETIDRFNEAWKTNVEGWDALRAEPFESPNNATANADNDAFYTVICEKYFSQIAAFVHELAPQKLYLGCRFAWNNDLARAAGQKYCDVVSYNFYRTSIEDFKPVEGPDKPVIIGEFHFGALDRGLFHTGLGPRANQDDRANAYKNYVVGALKNPWIIGTHWFQYQDQATTGRFDGENYQIGLIDVCDRPYKETIAAVREVGYQLYDLRQKASEDKE
ncbi:MAG: beta-galactosidase [Thermoguttaceae bacterium]|jgi:hypothetical protein